MGNWLSDLAGRAQKKAKQTVQAVGNDISQNVQHSAQVAGLYPRLPQQGQAGFGVVRPGARVMQQPQPQLPTIHHPSMPSIVGGAFKKVGMEAGLGAARVGSGLIQDTSGLIDAVSSGKGTSRVTKAATGWSQGLDRQANKVVPKDSAARKAYNIAQVSGNLGAFMIPGTLEAKTAALFPKAAKAAEVIDKGVAPVTKLINKGAANLATNGVKGRIAAEMLKGGASRTNLLNAAVGTAQDIGHQTSMNQQITPLRIAGDVASNLAMGTGMAGLPQVAREAVPGAKAGLDALSKRASQARNAVSARDAITNENKQLAREIKSHQKQQAGLDFNTDAGQRAHEVLQQKIDRKLAHISANNAQRPARNIIQKTTDTLLTTQPGLSMKDVSKQPNADRLNSILQYHEQNPRSVDLEAVKAEYKDNPEALKAIEASQAKVKTSFADAKLAAQKQAVVDGKFASAKTVGDIREAEAMQQVLRGKSTPSTTSINPKADHWTTPLPDDGKRPAITAKDTNGITPKEGDVIEFSSILGDANGKNKTGRTTVHWQGPYKANASGKEFPGQWIGNGSLNDTSIPFTIVKEAEKSTPPAAPAKKQLPVSPSAAKPAPQPQATGTAKVSLPKDNPDYAESKFPKRLKEDTRTEAVRPTIDANAYHEIKHNDPVMQAAAKLVAEDEDKALSLAKRGTTTEANATALHLLDKYLAAGKQEQADDLLKTVLPRFTRQGQETQILAVYSRMTPAGAVKYATQQLNKAAEKMGKTEKIDKLSDQLHGQLNETHQEASKQLETNLTSGDLSKKVEAVLQGRANTKAPKTPAEMLAARIKATEAKTNTPDPIKDMVNTLHKVAKEVLPAQGKTAPRDPMELIGAAIKDKKTYGDTYDKAKAIVMDKYKDNPAALDELEKYFSTDAARTYAKSQLNKGVQNGLKGVDLGKLVREHYTKVDETGADLKSKLMAQAGLSDHEAGQLAGDIQKRFTDLTSAKKEQILKQMFGEKVKPAQKDAVQKILEMSNLGAFHKDELRPALATKLGAPSLSKEATSQITKMADEIQKLKEGSPERLRRAAEMMQFIHKQVPSSLMDKALSTWTAGLLTGVKTITGAPTSNVATAVMKAPADAVAAGLDATRHALSGGKTMRTNTVVSPAHYIKGIGEGLGHAGRFMKTGIDERAAQVGDYGQKETNYNNKYVHNGVNGVFRLMGALDRPFYYGAKRMGEAEQAKLNRLNGGRAASSDDAAATVEAEARKAVLDHDTLLSKVASAVRQAVDGHEDPFSRGIGKVANTVNSPFVRVPSAGLSRMIDFSPAGAPMRVVRQAANMKWGNQTEFNWRDMNHAIGESAVGTGIVGLAYAMSQKNLISGAYPTSDQKEAKRWEAEGIQPNSAKINGQWISMNYLGPLGSLLQQGKRLQESDRDGNGKVQGLATSQLGMGRDALNQSYLQGISSAIDASKDPQRNLPTYAKNLAGTVVPSIANDVANSADKWQRQTNNPIQQAQSRTPGLRNLLPKKQTVYGDDLDQKTGPLSQFGNPLRPSKQRGSDVINEVSRLHAVDPKNGDLQVTPTPVGKTVTLPAANKGEKSTEIKLNDKQRYDLQKAVGQTTQSNWNTIIKSSAYQNDDDAGKAKRLTGARQDATELATRKYVVDNNLGSYAKPASKSAAALGNGDLSKYTSSSSGTTSGVTVNSSIDKHSRKVLNEYNTLDAATRKSKAYKENDYDYKVAQAKYDNDKANGSLTRVQDINRKQQLTKAKIGKDYSKDIRDIYDGLDKSEVYDLVSQDGNGNAIVKQLLAYGDALKAATGTQNKFRDKYGNVTIAPKTASGSGSGGGSGRSKLYTSSNNVSGRIALSRKMASTGKITAKKPSLSGKISGSKMKSYKNPTLYKKKVA